MWSLMSKPFPLCPSGFPSGHHLQPPTRTPPNQKLLCVHLPAWRCGQQMGASEPSRKRCPEEAKASSGLCSPASPHQLSRGLPIKWLLRAFTTTNQNCQNL